MKQASLVIEACFIRQRSLLRWALKQASFFSMIFKQKRTARTRGPKIPCYPRYPCATTQARNASNLFLSNNKKSRLILSDKPKISRLVCIGKRLFTLLSFGEGLGVRLFIYFTSISTLAGFTFLLLLSTTLRVATPGAAADWRVTTSLPPKSFI